MATRTREWIILGILMLCAAIAGGGLVCATGESQVLTLDQAIHIAMDNSLQRQLAVKDVAVANDKLAQAKSGYLPKLNLNAGYTHYNELPWDTELATELAEMNNAVKQSFTALNPMFGNLWSSTDIPDQTLDYYGYSLSFELPLYTGNKLEALNKQAEANQGYAQANLEVANHNLVYEVKKSYYTVITAQQFVETMQQAVHSMEDHVQEADAYYRAGMVSKLDVMRAEVKLTDLRQKLLMAQNGLVLAKMALNFVMGVNLDTSYTIVDDIKYEPIQMTLQACQENALANRPEVSAIRAKVEMAKQNVELAKSDGRPMVALKAENENFKPYNPDPSMQFGIVATMKLYDGGQIKNQVAEAEEVLQQAETAQELTNRAIKLEVEQAYQNLEIALQAIQVAEKSLDQAQETVHMAEVSYKAGLSSSLERIDAEVGLTQAKTNYTQALSLYKIAVAQLQKAIGQ